MARGNDLTLNIDNPTIPQKGKTADGRDISVITNELATRIDESSDTLIYIGYASLGANENSNSWKIKRIQKTGTVWKVEFADGNENYVHNRTNRASLNYS